MRTYQEVQKDLAAARSRRDTIKADLQAVHESAGGEELRDGQATRWENLTKGLTKVEHEVDSLLDESREAIAEGVRTGAFGLEEGSPPPADREHRTDDRGDPQRWTDSVTPP